MANTAKSRLIRTLVALMRAWASAVERLAAFLERIGQDRSPVSGAPTDVDLGSAMWEHKTGQAWRDRSSGGWRQGARPPSPPRHWVEHIRTRLAQRRADEAGVPEKEPRQDRSERYRMNLVNVASRTVEHAPGGKSRPAGPFARRTIVEEVRQRPVQEVRQDTAGRRPASDHDPSASPSPSTASVSRGVEIGREGNAPRSSPSTRRPHLAFRVGPAPSSQAQPDPGVVEHLGAAFQDSHRVEGERAATFEGASTPWPTPPPGMDAPMVEDAPRRGAAPDPQAWAAPDQPETLLPDDHQEMGARPAPADVRPVLSDRSLTEERSESEAAVDAPPWGGGWSTVRRWASLSRFLALHPPGGVPRVATGLEEFPERMGAPRPVEARDDGADPTAATRNRSEMDSGQLPALTDQTASNQETRDQACPWPSLAGEPSPDTAAPVEEWEATLRTWRRLDRLEHEQQGDPWSASPF